MPCTKGLASAEVSCKFHTLDVVNSGAELAYVGAYTQTQKERGEREREREREMCAYIYTHIYICICTWYLP